VKGKPRRAWMKGIKAWRLRTKETPSMYETEYLCTSDKWANDVNITMYKEFPRAFRIPFGLYQDIVEAAYAFGRFSDDRPGLKKKRARGAPPSPLTVKILASLRVMALGCPMDGMRLESGISQPMLAKFFHKLIVWMVEKYFEDDVHMPSDTTELESVETVYSLVGFIEPCKHG
jgi:hypothetical protein